MKQTKRDWKTISPEAIQQAAGILKCIGHADRLAILEFLDERGERTVTEIHQAVGLDQPAASRHLVLMRDRGILARRRDGVNVLYRIDDDRVVQVLDCLRACEL